MAEPAALDDAPATLSGRGYAERLAASSSPAFDARRIANGRFLEWRDELRAKLWELVGGPGEPSKPELRVGIPQPADGYSVRRLTFSTEPGVRASALLLSPSPGRRRAGAVLALHGHGGGKEQLVDPGDGAFARALAQRGFLVLVPDGRGFGERGHGNEDGCHILGLTSLWLGQPVAGQRLRDDRAALSVLRPLAGTDRIAAVGLSEGGRRAAWLAALDDRVRFAAVSGYFTLQRGEIAAWDRLAGWDICNVIPGLLQVADQPEILSLIAPRPLWVEVGDSDPLFTPEAVAEAADALRAGYTSAGAPEALRMHRFAGGHRFSGGPCIDWIEERLT